MSFVSGLWTITSIELRQRVRGVAWYVLLGLFVGLNLLVSAGLTIAFGFDTDGGGGLYSTIIYFILLLASLVTPALGGNSINGDRDAGTLATTQVTLVTTPQLVLGKFLAAWISSLAFLVAAIPFLLYSFALGGVQPLTVVISFLMLAVLLAVISAVAVGLSGMLQRPLFSIVVTYLVVATLSVGTLIAFGLGGVVLQTKGTYTSAYYDGDRCVIEEYETTNPRFDLVWWVLAANPYVIVADAAAAPYKADEYPSDLFGSIQLGVRGSQISFADDTLADCESTYTGGPEPREIIATTTPGWLVGLLINLALGAGALLGAIRSTHAPARRLSAGSRIA